MLAQNSLSGRLVNTDKETLIGATVILQQNDSILALLTTDLDGFFCFKDLKKGDYNLKGSYLGMQPIQEAIKLDNESIDLGRIELHTAATLTQVTVSNQGTPGSSILKNAPTVALKQVVTPQDLQNIFAPTNLIESISLVNGLQENVACGVCFTNNISINGLPGQYAAIMIDGTPMYGNLASVYALNGLPNTMIDRIEVTKGPSSTIFGSEAVAGVINIITKDPKKEPLISLDLKANSLFESYNNLSWSHQWGTFSTMLGIHHAYSGSFIDNNQDGFGDVINLDRLSAFVKISVDRKKNRRSTVFARYYYEDRRNGVAEYLKDRNYLQLRGDQTIYGESIFTQRWEVLGSYDLPTAEYFKLDYSLSGHYQDSYYGADFYKAQQYIAYTNFNWNKYVKGHGISAGLTFRYQYYDDNTIATQDTVGNKQLRHQFIPGIFLQDAWDISKKTALLYGCRLDYYKDHQLIPAPRFNLKYKPDPWTTFRFNFGTGFRIVNLFSEDHAFITGNRILEIAETLNPEQSYNVALNFNYIFSIGPSKGSINIEGFYTYFTNAIFPDYSQANRIIYKNLDGFAQTRGFSLNYTQQFKFPLSINLSYNMQWATQSTREADGSLTNSNLEYAPLYSGSLVLNYTFKKIDLNVAYTGRLTGAMQLPEVYDLLENGQPNPLPRPTTSIPFGLHNIQLTKEFCSLNLSIYVGVENLLNFRQNYSPLAGYNSSNVPAGFSDYFDTAYAYGPIDGRSFYVGIRWKWSPKQKR
jgi:outer membrane receptor for ferrienterochelin and colicins